MHHSEFARQYVAQQVPVASCVMFPAYDINHITAGSST
eukprot:gene7651-6193_t